MTINTKVTKANEVGGGDRDKVEYRPSNLRENDPLFEDTYRNASYVPMFYPTDVNSTRRVVIDGEVYCYPLVDINHPEASNIHVYTDEGLKAMWLPKNTRWYMPDADETAKLWHEHENPWLNRRSEYLDENDNDWHFIADWYDLRDIDNDLHGYHTLSNDLDINSPGYDDLVKDGWNPIGDGSNPFTGIFDGSGYRITDLIVDMPDASGWTYAGLFGHTIGASFSDVSVEGEVNLGGEGNAGMLVGNASENDEYGVPGISDCNSSGAVNITSPGSGNAGGLVGGQLDGLLQDCYSTANVFVSTTANADKSYQCTAGGLLGYGSRGLRINRSFATGDVSASGDVIALDEGGLLGREPNEGVDIGTYTVSDDNDNSYQVRCFWNADNTEHGCGQTFVSSAITSVDTDTNSFSLYGNFLIRIGETVWVRESNNNNGTYTVRDISGSEVFVEDAIPSENIDEWNEYLVWRHNPNWEDDLFPYLVGRTLPELKEVQTYRDGYWRIRPESVDVV